MVVQLRIARSVIAELLAEARRAAPEECCGLLLGASGIASIAPAANVAPDRRREFEIDPRTLIAAHKAERSGGTKLLGYYHSHPAGGAEPSATDRARAAGDGRIWAIVGTGEVRFWRDTPSGFESLCHTLADD
jgi:proteasome lid subunit RPN8/RPN11